MSLSKLKTLIDENSANLISLSDEAAATYINAKNQAGTRKVKALDLVDLLGYTTGKSLLETFKTLAETNVVIEEAREELRANGIDINKPRTQEIIDLLVAGGHLASDKGNALKALNTNQQSLASKYKLGRVTASDVSIARTM